MDFSKHLADYELEYELNIRKVFSTRPLKDRIKILRKLLMKESSEPRSQVNQFTTTYDNECYEINQSVKSIRDTIEEFEGTDHDYSYFKLKSRIIHVVGRVQDTNIPNDRLEGSSSFKNETYASCIQCEAELDEKLQVTSINEPVLNQTSNISNP
ncbi:hypothetical protein JTB14_012408 [Gonioctena quinquepunctata]|nr:hypothetical protein JTB14_012408 [Gonioctena quinquepunctata]